MVKTIRSILFIIIFIGLCVFSLAQPVACEDSHKIVKQNFLTTQESILREQFKEYICRYLRKAESDVIVSGFKVKGNKPVPVGKISFKLFQKNMVRLQGHVKIIAAVKVNRQVINEIILSGYVDIFESVVCTSRNLKKGDVIKKEDVYLAKKDISHLSSKVLTHIDKAEGLMAKHNLRAGTCLKEWMLEKTHTLEKGDIVTILAESGDMKVTVPGRVLMKGYTGELIKVQNLMSKKNIYAKVVNNSTVTVEF